MVPTVMLWARRRVLARSIGFLATDSARRFVSLLPGAETPPSPRACRYAPHFDMPLLADVIAALAAGLLALAAARWYARSAAMPERPTEEIARAAGEAVPEHTRLRRVVGRGLAPSRAAR